MINFWRLNYGLKGSLSDIISVNNIYGNKLFNQIYVGNLQKKSYLVDLGQRNVKHGVWH